MARPKKKASETKTGILQIRLTESERQTIGQAAKVKNLETSTWARMELLALAKRILARQD
jgi:uncharacterized protein (DUF1778 family)